MKDPIIHLTTDELPEKAAALKVGDRVLLSGTVYTARDAAHKAIFRLLDAGEPAPFEISGAVIYYAGPTPGHDGLAVGSCGPTTSTRMDGFSPRLLSLGLCAMIGKGNRSETVRRAIADTGAVYFGAVGGAGALIARSILSAEVIAFPELGCESVKKLTVKDMPLTVCIDASGRDLFEEGRTEYSELN